MTEKKYPVFRNPEDYMKCRVSKTPLGFLKTKSERAALDRCLAATSGVRTICDVPSGPGRLFPYWHLKDFRVHGVDVSGPMVQASTEMHKKLKLQGTVGSGDAFKLGESLPEEPDLVASIRFLYYFDREERVRLLKSLADASRRYVLVQYKSTETLKGQKSIIRQFKRKSSDHLKLRFCSHEEIVDELRQAGLIPLRIDPVGEFSDRVYVLAEKPQADPALAQMESVPEIRLVVPWRHKLVMAMILIFGFIYTINFVERSFWGEHEAFYSLGAKNVLEGDWLIPHINTDLPADNPPLMFWWIAMISSLAGGVAEWTSRLANVIPALGVMAVLYAYGKRLFFGPWASLAALVVLGTSYEFWIMARDVTPDMLLLFLLTIAWSSMYVLLTEKFSRLHWALMWGGLALAMLTKGPVAVVLTALIATAFCGWLYGLRGIGAELKRLRPVAGLAMAVAPFLAWIGAVAYTHGSKLLSLILYKQNFLRFVDTFEHEKSWYFYFGELPLNLLPWAVLLPLAGWQLFRQRGDLTRSQLSPESGAGRPQAGRNRATCFALTVCSVVFLFFSLSSAKRDYYLLPLMPWCALLIGDWIWQFLCTLSPVKVKGEHTQHEFGGVILGLRLGRTLLFTVVVMLLGMTAYAIVATEWLDARKSPKPFALAVSDNVETDEHLIIFDNNDPRIMFYLLDKFDLESDDAPGMDRIHSMLDSGQDIDLLVRSDDIDKFANIKGHPLYVENILSYRNKEIYHLTSENEKGLSALTQIK